MLKRRLKELLNQHKMTQVELCRQVHTSPSTMSSILNGRSVPDIELLSRIATYFGVKLDFFINFNTTSNLGECLLLSELTESSKHFLKNGAWIYVDTLNYLPTLKPDSLIYVESCKRIDNRDLVLFFNNVSFSIYRVFISNTSKLFTPISKNDVPLCPKNFPDSYFKIQYIAYKP